MTLLTNFLPNYSLPILIPILLSNTTLYTCKFRKLVRQEVKTLEQSRQACEKHGSIHINVLLYMEARELKFLYLTKQARPQAELVY